MAAVDSLIAKKDDKKDAAVAAKDDFVEMVEIESLKAKPAER